MSTPVNRTQSVSRRLLHLRPSYNGAWGRLGLQGLVSNRREGVRMAIEKSENIWHNGKLIPWDKATIHVMSHVVHYGSSVFEGIRCYAPPSGPAIFRAKEHMQRLLDSARVYRIDVDYTRDQLIAGMSQLIAVNKEWP